MRPPGWVSSVKVKRLGRAGVIPGGHHHLDGDDRPALGHRGAVAKEPGCVPAAPVHQYLPDQLGVGAARRRGEYFPSMTWHRSLTPGSSSAGTWAIACGRSSRIPRTDGGRRGWQPASGPGLRRCPPRRGRARSRRSRRGQRSNAGTGGSSSRGIPHPGPGGRRCTARSEGRGPVPEVRARMLDELARTVDRWPARGAGQQLRGGAGRDLRHFAGLNGWFVPLVSLLPVPSPPPGPAPAPAPAYGRNLQGRSPPHTGGGSRH